MSQYQWMARIIIYSGIALAWILRFLAHALLVAGWVLLTTANLIDEGYDQ
jgi:hypothetical protein